MRANVIRKHRPEAVINFAATAYVGEAMKEPVPYYRTNVAGIITLLENRPRISMFGTDYETPDGTRIRHYVYVTDLALAHVAAISACRPGQFSAYNIGTGQVEVIARVRGVTGKPIPTDPEARRPGDPPVLVADVSLAKTALNWSLRHSNLENIIANADSWMTEHRTHVVVQTKAG
jgi:UDP-glucose 4-epimerase